MSYVNFINFPLKTYIIEKVQSLLHYNFPQFKKKFINLDVSYEPLNRKMECHQILILLKPSDETAERDHKRQKIDHYTQPQTQAQSTESTQSEAQTPPQQIHSPHKTHPPQPPALEQKDTPKLNTPVAVKIKRWE